MLILNRNTMNENINIPLKAVVVLVGIILALVILAASYNYLYYTLPPEQVNVSVSYSPANNCRSDSPVYMLITNDSYRDIITTSFSLSIKKGVDSDNFIQLLEKNYATEQAIKAGDSYGGCWAYPKLNTRFYDPEKLIYEIKRKQITFKS